MARGGRAGHKSTLNLLVLGAVVFALAWLCGQLLRESGVPAPVWLGNAVVLAALAAQSARSRGLRERLGRALADARDEARKVGMAQSVAHMGYWRFDAATQELSWSPEMFRLFGLPADAQPSAAEMIGMVHPDDRGECRRLFQAALLDGQPYEQEVIRLQPAGGGDQYAGGRAIVERAADGSIVGIFGVLFDRTEAVRHQLAKDTAEARYRLIAEQAHDIIVRADLLGRVLYISPACRALGYEPEELIGALAPDLIHPEDLPRFAENTAQLLRDGVPAADADRRHRIRCKDGHYLWVEGNPAIITDDAGAPVELLNVFRDITARKRAEEELAAKEAKLQLLTDHAPDLLVHIDNKDTIVYASPASRRFGYEPEDLVGRVRSTLVHPEDLERLSRVLTDAIGSQRTAQAERQYRIRHADGSWVWVEGSLSLVHDDNGVAVGGVSLLRDISERRAAAAALAESEARYRTLADNVTDIIVRFGPDGLVRYISPACRTLGLDPEEAVGRSVLEVIAPRQLAEAEGMVAELLRGVELDPTARRVYEVVGPDDAVLWFEGSPTLVRDESGAVVEVVSVLRDVTARERLEADLRAARTEAESATQVKSEFLANMSHELRTPLTSVVGFTKLAAEQADLSPLTRSYIDRVDQAGRALLCAVNDILDFSKLEAGQVSFQPEAVRLPQLAQAALELFQPQAGAKDLHLAFESDAPDDLTLLLDPDRLRQVLLNLISNAVKFTAEGAVTLNLAYDEGAGELRVDIRDTGAGIPEDRLEGLFKRFSQVDGSLTRAHGGTGLGLAICKGIVEAQGGSIGVTSVLGEGSVFTISIPALRVATSAVAADGQAPSSVTFSGVRVLVVDDHPANRELARLILSGVGAEVTEAADGEAGVELAADWPFDLILMDLRMPRLDGAGALARIRREPGPNDATPILAFTADADPDIEQHLQRLGFDGLVGKPVAPGALIAAVAQATAFANTPFRQEVAHAG
jgi:PAS domain S-box-containing protein